MFLIYYLKILVYGFLFSLPQFLQINILFLINCTRFKREYYLIVSSSEFGFNNYICRYKNQNVWVKSKFADKLNLSNNLYKYFKIAVNVPEQLIVFCDASQIKKFDFKSISDFKFIIKANHGSGMNTVVQNNKVIDNRLIGVICKWFKFPSHFISNELHYSLFPKRVFIEELIGDNVTDYKLFCYQGKCRVIQLDFDRYINHTRNLYSRDWELLDFEFVYENKSINFDKPKEMDEMIILSEKIAANFEFVRVDWFLVEDRFYLGELTFHPEGGVGPFKNKQQDIDFLNYLKSS